MKSLCMTLLVVIAGGLAGQAVASPELAKSKNCMGCHAVDRKMVGPAYKDVAAKYKGDKKAADALAATIKAGKADAGFGLEAAAAEFGLAFVPVVRESYFFACRRRALRSEAVGAFRALLADADTRAVVSGLPGYALDAPGALAELARAPDGAVGLL